MKLLSNNEEQLIFSQSASAGSLLTIPEAGLSSVKGDFGNIFVQQIQAGNFTIYYNQYQIKNDCSFYFAMDEPSLELHFMEHNQMGYRLSELGMVETGEKEFNITYLPYIESFVTLKAGNNYSTFDIHFPVKYLAEFCSVHPLIDSFMRQVVNNKASQYSSGRQKASVEMITIIRRILYNSFSTPALYNYLESKAIELLMVSLQALSLEPEVGFKVRKDDLERIHEAESIIMANLENPYSLLDLAHKAGINDYKLKKVFKHVYGTTVFGYLMEAKMEKAKLLVLDTLLSFGDIAFETGFKNVPNFNEAFKRKFGCAPGYMRRHR